MELELQDTSMSQQVKTPEIYKELLLDEFGLELDIAKTREIGSIVKQNIVGDPTVNNIGSALKKSRMFNFTTVLYYSERIPKRVLVDNPSSLFILTIWNDSADCILGKIKGEGTIVQKATKLSDFFRRDKYALATIFGFFDNSSTAIINSVTTTTVGLVAQ